MRPDNKHPLGGRIGLGLLSSIMGAERGQEAEDDLLQLYDYRQSRQSPFRASVRFWRDIAGILIRPRLWQRDKNQIIFTDMFRANVGLAFRRVKTNPGYSAINAFGLGLGLACVVLIFLFVRHELSYDRHHVEADRIHRVTLKYLHNGVHWAPIGPPVGPAMARTFPEVAAMTRFFR